MVVCHVAVGTTSCTPPQSVTTFVMCCLLLHGRPRDEFLMVYNEP